jgi:hypothetical protein
MRCTMEVGGKDILSMLWRMTPYIALDAARNTCSVLARRSGSDRRADGYLTDKLSPSKGLAVESGGRLDETDAAAATVCALKDADINAKLSEAVAERDAIAAYTHGEQTEEQHRETIRRLTEARLKRVQRSVVAAAVGMLVRKLDRMGGTTVR